MSLSSGASSLSESENMFVFVQSITGNVQLPGMSSKKSGQRNEDVAGYSRDGANQCD